MLIRLVIVLVLLLVVVAIARAWIAAGRQPASDPVLPVVRRVRELAWDHRDIEPTLATALIDRVARIEASGRADNSDLDALLELAWEHRDSDTALSVLVVDLIRSERRGLEG